MTDASKDHEQDINDPKSFLHPNEIGEILGEPGGVSFHLDMDSGERREIPYWDPDGRREGHATRIITAEAARMLLEYGDFDVGVTASNAGVYFFCAEEEAFRQIYEVADSIPDFRNALIADKYYSFMANDVVWVFGLCAPGLDRTDELRRGAICEDATRLVVCDKRGKIINHEELAQAKRAAEAAAAEA